ncbi:MAG: DUF1588 domain-containing protein [Pseudobdellovibrionaceae bacterium]
MNQGKKFNCKKWIALTGVTGLLFFFNNCSQNSGFEVTLVESSDFASLGSASKFTCAPDAIPVTSPLLRLTKKQYVNTLRSLVDRAVTTADRTNVTTFFASAAVQTTLNSFPTEGLGNKGNELVYDTSDQRLSGALVRNQFELAYQVAQFIVSDPARLNQFVRFYSGNSICATETVTNTTATPACYQAFIQGFGLRALRRPIENKNNSIDAGSTDPEAQNDLAYYSKVFTTPTNGGFDSLIASMLVSPDSLFLTGFKGSANSQNQIALSSYEVAAKLAYSLTDYPPDETLLTAAINQFQGSGQTLNDQTNRLLNSTLARGRFNNFYSQWLRPDSVPTLVATTGAPATNLTTLKNNAIQELVDMAEFYTFGKPNGKASDLVSSNLSFAKTADVASLYGVPTWAGKKSDGTYDLNAVVPFPASSPRAGLFTRAAFAFSGSRESNLILRGAKLRRDYLCNDFAPPNNTVLDTSIPVSGPPTQRNIVIAGTQTGSCKGCHEYYINPLGFALENYDAFGRYRALEDIYSSSNQLVQSVPVNAVVAPRLSQGNPTVVDGGVAFSQHLGTSEEFNTCFVRHFFRYTEARNENNRADGCDLLSMKETLMSDSGGLKEMIRSSVQRPSFFRRQINP